MVSSVELDGDWQTADVLVPPPGWAVAPDVQRWFDNRETLGTHNRVPARCERLPDLRHIYVRNFGGGSIEALSQVAANRFEAGEIFPTAEGGVFAVLAQVGLVAGDVIEIRGPND